MEFVPRTPSHELQPGSPGTISNHITFYLGGGQDLEFGRFYILWRDGRMLTIQAEPPRKLMPTIQDEDREYNSFLATIQTMLDDIHFDRGNWAYLIRDEDDCDRLLYKNRPFSLSCTIWTTLIDESDIEITKWGGVIFREGLWNGRKVDLCTPYLEGSSWAMLAEWLSEGHRLMHAVGLKELTFEMLGHIVRDGTVVGVLTEASCGRLVEFTDRAAVYEAVARMQQKGIIHRSLHAGNIFITDSGVRFLGISSVLFFEDNEKLVEMAQKWHWGCLAKVFDQLKDRSFNDHPWMRKIPAPAVLLPRLPSPNRPFPAVPGFSKLMYLFSLYLADPFKYHEWLKSAASSPDSRTVVRSKKYRANLPVLLSVRRHGRNGVDAVFDAPPAGSLLSSSRMRIELPGFHHPYFRGRSSRTAQDDVIVSSNAIDSTL